ncbi:MAG: LmbU family transcriptional regulator [Streptosporangiaceae bacterium]
MPATGLNLPRRLNFDTWLGIGRQLSTTVSASAWCLGDWLIYGETAFTGRYRDAIERTSLDYKTLRNYAWVARRFSLSRRRPTLSFGHHAEIAALPEPEQDYWLRKAEQFGWSRNQVRHEVRASHKERNGERPGELDPQPSPPARGGPVEHTDLTILLQVTPEQLRLYQQAAGQHGHSIEAWASLTLDRAARACVPPYGPALATACATSHSHASSPPCPRSPMEEAAP